RSERLHDGYFARRARSLVGRGRSRRLRCGDAPRPGRPGARDESLRPCCGNRGLSPGRSRRHHLRNRRPAASAVAGPFLWTPGLALDLGQWLDAAASRLANGEAARADAEELLGRLLQLTRSELYLERRRTLTAAETATLEAWIARRLAGEPVQHITGRAAF